MWALVINPVSGQGKGARIGTHVAGYLNGRGISYEIIIGRDGIDQADLLQRFIDRNPDCSGVIAVGGDGLLHLVLQKITPAQVPLALIPAGTGNDFVRTLGWSPDDLDAILEAVLTKKPSSVDLGLVDGEWFGAVLSTGFDAIVNERANAMSWPKGPNRYNVAIAIELPRFTPRHYEIVLEDRTISTQAMLIAVANGRSYGGGMLVCPQSDIADGYFDVMVLHPVSKLEFIKVFPRVFKGTHITHPAVEIVRSKSVKITANAVAYADGERVGQLPISAQCMPGALMTWVP